MDTPPPAAGHVANPSNYKTVLCRYFAKGACQYGDQCTFAHGPADMRKPGVKKLKTKLCKNFAAGDCKWGDRCNFAHGEEERQPTGARVEAWAPKTWAPSQLSPCQGVPRLL
jgi:hypothetical protein